MKKGNAEVGSDTAEESTKLAGGCENPGRSICLEHSVTFDQEIGEICGVCGFVLVGLQDIWVHDVSSSCTSAMLEYCRLKLC